MKFLVQLFLLSVLCIGLSSCEDDQDVVDSTIIGRSWTGDVGMLDDFGMSVKYIFFRGRWFRRRSSTLSQWGIL